MAASSSSTGLPPQHQVFINFRGEDLRLGFVSHLVEALENDNIKVFIDNYADKGEPLETLLTKIHDSKIALAIFSGKYTESTWCLRELAMIKDCVEKGKLVAIPIFYKVDPSTVRGVRGQFGDAFRDLEERDVIKKKEWKQALKWIPGLIGITVHDKSPESEILNEIVKEVKKVLKKVSLEGSQKVVSVDPSQSIDTLSSVGGEKDKTFGIKQRLKELEEKLDLVKYKGTRVIGVVGMPGIGKTTLVKELYKTWQGKFSRYALIDQIRGKSNNFRLECLPTLLLEKLLPELNNPQLDSIEEPYKTHKGLLRERKVLVVLDDVSRREQIYALLGKYDLHSKHEWIKDGSRIIIATNDISSLKGLVHDTYVVRQLNHRDGLQLFRYHAFHYDQATPPKVDFMKLSDEFVHYARGHPLALKILGRELYEKNMKHWETKLIILAQSPTTYIGEVVQVSYDELSLAQKDAFLDIACFRSQDVDYVESLLVSSDPGSAEAIKALKNKFLIDTCDGRVEMHDLLYRFSRELDLKASTQGGSKQRRLWVRQDIINVQQKTMGAANVRGIFLDLSEVKVETSLDREHFKNMRNLRYLKLYNSHCPHECLTNNKINMPDGLELPLKEVRCLHWLKFPLEELPNDFDPINLVDLKLPYSEIERLWDGVKVCLFIKCFVAFLR
jgi:hypothetical protein